MNFAQLTEKITKLEGKKVNVNIAQVKEITKITLAILAGLSVEEFSDLLKNKKRFLKTKKKQYSAIIKRKYNLKGGEYNGQSKQFKSNVRKGND